MSIGIVKVADYVARPYLESGRLTQVLTDWAAEQEPISVMYPQNRHLSAKVRIFVEWVSGLIPKDAQVQPTLDAASRVESTESARAKTAGQHRSKTTSRLSDRPLVRGE